MSVGKHDPFALGGVQDDPVFALIEEYRRVRHTAETLFINRGRQHRLIWTKLIQPLRPIWPLGTAGATAASD